MMNTYFLAVEGLLSTFQGDDYVHPQNGCWTLYWQEICIEKRMSANVKTSFAYHIHLCVQSTFFLLVCMYHFFVHSWLSIPFSIFLLPGSWVLTWEFFLQKRYSQFHLFLVSLNPWVWTFLNAHENEIFWCSGEGILLTVRSAKRNNQLVQAAVNKLVKKNDCN